MVTGVWTAAKCEASACVEVLAQHGSIIVRSSKRPDELVVFDSDEWGKFLDAVKKGVFDL